MSIPTQDNCDLNNPREAFLWMLVGLSNSKVPLIFPRQILEDISERIWLAGGRPHPELQQIYYKPPAATDENSIWDSMGGEWVRAAAPGQRPEDLAPTAVENLLDQLDDNIKQQLSDELERRGF